MDLRLVLDEIKQNLDLTEIMPDVKRSGANYMCCCPFHADSSPSMVVHPSYYLCYGCGATGDVFSWLQHESSLDFMQAVQVAALRAGIVLEDDVQAQVQKLTDERNKRAETLDFYQKKLADSTKAREYLTNRGLTEETIQHFGLGYKPDEDAIAIPILNRGNAVESISLRYIVTPTNGKGKYKHQYGMSKKGQFYNVQSLEFGSGPVYICEGMFDVMSLWQAGYQRSLAIMGSGLSDEHIKQIGENPIVFVPDRVKEGDYALFRKAVIRARQAFPKHVIKAAILPQGHDANSAGVDAIRAAVEAAKCAELAILEADLGEPPDLSTNPDLSAEYSVARQVATDVNDPLTKDDIVRYLAKRWGKDRDVVRDSLSRSTDTPYHRVKTIAEVIAELEEREKRSAVDGVGLNGIGMDKYIDRPHTSQVALIAARANVGKTIIALNILYNCAKHRVPTLFISEEQPSSELVNRLALMLSGDTGQSVDSRTLRHNIINGTDWWKQHSSKLIELFPHLRFEERQLNPDGVRDAIIDASHALGERVKVVFIDYMGLLKPNHRTDSPYERMSTIMRDMQAVTKELDVFGIYIMQLSREGKDGSEKVTLNMLRDSGVSEEVADYIIGAWRDKDRNQYENMGVSKMYLNVCKNRHGKTGETELWMDMATLRLRETETRYDDYGVKVEEPESRWTGGDYLHADEEE